MSDVVESAEFILRALDDTRPGIPNWHMIGEHAKILAIAIIERDHFRSDRIAHQTDSDEAEHPADDDEPITDCYHTGDDWRDPWLLSVGFKPDDEQDYLWINSGVNCDFDLQARAAGPWFIADSEYEFPVPRPKTRRDVRRLCAALGIELTEGGPQG